MSLLTPIKDQKHLYRNHSNGRVENIGDFKPWSVSIPVAAGTATYRTKTTEMCIIQHWGFVLHPWPSALSPEITALLFYAQIIEAESPLFRVAQPRDRNTALEQRLERVEKLLDGTAMRSEGVLNKGDHLRACGQLDTIEGKILLPPYGEFLVDTEIHLILSGIRRELVL